MAQSEYFVSRSSRIISSGFYHPEYIYHFSSPPPISLCERNLHPLQDFNNAHFSEFTWIVNRDGNILREIFLPPRLFVSYFTPGNHLLIWKPRRDRTPLFITDNSLVHSGRELICMRRAPRLFVRFSHLDPPSCRAAVPFPPLGSWAAILAVLIGLVI